MALKAAPGKAGISTLSPHRRGLHPEPAKLGTMPLRLSGARDRAAASGTCRWPQGTSGALPLSSLVHALDLGDDAARRAIIGEG